MSEATSSSKRRPGRPTAEMTPRQERAATEVVDTLQAIESAEDAHGKALAKAYRAGLGSTRLARLVGVTEPTMRARLRAAGVDVGRKAAS